MRTIVRATEDRALAARIVSTRELWGVHAGSALLRIGDRLLAVHDDAFRVSWIALPALDVTGFPLRDDGAQLAKRAKPDFEAALATPDGALHVLGSGSTEKRCTLARIDLASATVSVIEHPALYRCAQDALRLRTRPNIEGAFAYADRLRLFHRGDAGTPSASVDVPLDALAGGTPRALATQAFELGALDGIALGLTDAALLRDARTAFVATAEDAPDALADGPVAGSTLGVFEGTRGATTARWTRLIESDGTPCRHKVEGLVIDDDLRHGWILTDEDDPARPALLGRVELTGFA